MEAHDCQSVLILTLFGLIHSYRKPSTLQLAGKDGYSLVFQLHYLSSPLLKQLNTFLSDPRHVFTGVKI